MSLYGEGSGVGKHWMFAYRDGMFALMVSVKVKCVLTTFASLRLSQQEICPLRATREGKNKEGLHMGELSLFFAVLGWKRVLQGITGPTFRYISQKFHLNSVLRKSLSCRNVRAISPLSFQNNQNRIESCSCLLWTACKEISLSETLTLTVWFRGTFYDSLTVKSWLIFAETLLNWNRLIN